MAPESVAPRANTEISQPDFIYSEKDPFERAGVRLSGLWALSRLAGMVIDSDVRATDKVWSPLWDYVSLLAEDTRRDLHQMHQDARKTKRGS